MSPRDSPLCGRESSEPFSIFQLAGIVLDLYPRQPAVVRPSKSKCQLGYRCLKSYYNQRYHDQLVWPLAMPYLEELRQAEPHRRPLETGDIDDPRPWLEAYAAGVGSPLELKFLRLFEQHGFHPDKQVPVSPTDGGAPISVADFAVSERRVAIYVDGAAFHTGVILRRDRYIRSRLREGSPPWKVVELTAADLRRGAELIAEINAI